MPRRAFGVVAIVLASCQSVAPTVAPSTIPAAKPPETTAPSLTDLAERIRPHRSALLRAGIRRYRFRSEVRVAGSDRMRASYEATATVEPATLRLTSDGMVGSFDIVLGDSEGWYRYPGIDWVRIDPSRPWRWNPAGPIYSYALAGIIAEMTLEAAAVETGREPLRGRPTTKAVKDFEDGTQIQVWVSDDGVVMKVVVTEPVPSGGTAILEWEIYDINGDFTVEAPLP